MSGIMLLRKLYRDNWEKVFFVVGISQCILRIARIVRLNFPRKNGHQFKPQAISPHIPAALRNRIPSDAFFGENSKRTYAISKTDRLRSSSQGQG